MPRGNIEVITGCMFSGKSNKLLIRLERAQIANLNVAAFKPMDDHRVGSVLQSRTGRRLEATPVANAKDILNQNLTVDVIGIDEAHFFDTDIIDTVQTLSAQDIRVVIAGLDLDYKGNPFESMAHLMAVATDVKKLKAVCMLCYEERATRSKRLIKNPNRKLVGDKDIYEARCLSCFHVGS